MIFESLFLSTLVISSFYLCEVVNEGHGTSDHVRGFHQTYVDFEESEDCPSENGPEEDPSIETVFTITLSNDDSGRKVAIEDGWPGPRSFACEDDLCTDDEESLLRKGGKGPMRLHFRVPWRENPLFNDSNRW